MGQLVKPNNPIGARWDKLKSWKVLKEDILNKISSSEKLDEGITLDIGPQLLHTLRHPSLLRCVVHASSKLGEIFTAHYNKGAVQSVKVWTLESKNRNGICKHVVFETESEITSITYVSKHRVYLAFCSDLTLRVFTDSNRNFVEVHSIPCLTTILCLIYNKEDDEVYAGGIGILEEWKIQGAEHAASVVPGRRFFTDLTRNEWIRDIQTDKQNNQMFALHGNGICVLNFKTRKQMHRLPNRHDGPLKCCCYYPQNDYLVTGGADGKIKLFNGTVFNLLHVFLGHHGPVTSLEPHKKDTLLFSSSHDGTVRIWRMDSLQIFMRLDIGEKIMHLALLSNSEFYFRTEKDIMIYSLNQFYQMFAPVESETKKLVCCRGKLKPNRILGSTEDGSVRVFSPVTGLTLTIIYPMPSFQVLTSFAYDIHQDKMHTVLTGGRVLVYNTVTNPCKAEEIWTPNCEDEEVNNLLLVTVEFMCEDGMDMDNLVFAGLKNGQIILCEAVVCTLEVPIQAHEGALTCLESCLHLGTVGHSIQETSSIILSGGTDNFIKIWSIGVDCEKRRPIVNLSQMIKIYLPSFPSHICMFANIVSVSIMANTTTGPRWRLIMFQLISSSLKRKSLEQNIASGDTIMPLQITHSEDEDHSMELTALDKCPIMKVVLTAGKDGFVKVWNSKNELLREMNFATPIYASCFANDRGDILVGYGTHICSVSVVNYLPLDCLKNVVGLANIELKDDARELPVKFDPKCEPWLDLSNLNQYSIDIYERRRKHLEEEVIERLKRATEKDQATTKFVIFVDGGTTKVIRKDFADRLLNWAKGKSKLINKFSSWKGGADLSSLTEDEIDTETRGNKINEKRKGAVGNGKFKVKKEELSVTAEPQFLDSEGLIEIYPSTVGKALRRLRSQKVLGLVEMKLLQEKELLKKEPIIAPDGYIPNSVIRRKLKPPPADPNLLRRVEKPFKLKPVPKVNPDHLPSWWGKEDEKEMTPSGWDDSSLSERPDTNLGRSNLTSALSGEVQRSPELSESQTGVYKALNKMKPGTPTAAYVLKSKRLDLTRVDLEMGTPDSRRGRRSGGQSVERTKSFKLTNLAVDEDSSMIHIKETKSGRRIKANMFSEIIQQLIGENWMPKLEGQFEYEDVLDSLITVLDNNNPIVYDSVCTYLKTIFQELGIPEDQMNFGVDKLGGNLNNINTAIRKHTLRTLQVLGMGRKDVIMLVLPILIDPEEIIAKSAAETIEILTGAHDKEALLSALTELGITGGIYDSKEDEELTLRVLAERFAEQREEPQYYERILDWVEGTTPGLCDMFDEDRSDNQLWQEGSRKSSMYQGKERSFVSDGGKSGKKEATTPRKRAETESTMRRKLNDGDGFSTISDKSFGSIKSRNSERFTPKDPNLYKYYDQQENSKNGVPAPGLHEEEDDENKNEKLPNRDSDIHTISNVTSSQITERLSGQDSGIARDMSEFSYGRGYARGFRPGAPLSPVKSGSEISSPVPHLKRQPSPKDWRKFFDLPNAVERRRMEQIKKEMEQGKLKPSTLPPISYFSEDLPMLPGEAGTRLLQKVRVGEKMLSPKDGRHRIESVPGKLAVHTQNEAAGLSSFGILQMQWTTGVPTVKDQTQPPQRIAQHRSHDTKQRESRLMSLYSQHGIQPSTSEELNLPYLSTASPHISNRHSPGHYEWELPLPPPPAKESRTNVAHIKKEHDNYCKYYQLVKKKLHLYTSQKRESPLRLPEVFVKQLRERQLTQQSNGGNGLEKARRSPSKSTLNGQSLLFPPIKLGQLIKTC